MSNSMYEKEFYAKHYKEGLSVRGEFNFQKVKEKCFSPGARYNLVDRVMEKYAGATDFIVELGCAEGHTLTYCKNRYGFRRAVGVDIALPADHVNIAGVEFVTINLNQGFPFVEGEVDVLMAMMCFEHLFCPFFVFGEVKRCLAEKGVAFVNVPLVTSIKNRIRLALGKLPVTSVGYEHWFGMNEWDGNHLHYFSVDSIRQLAEKFSLEVTNVAGIGRFHQLKSVFPSLLAGEATFAIQHKKG